MQYYCIASILDPDNYLYNLLIKNILWLPSIIGLWVVRYLLPRTLQFTSVLLEVVLLYIWSLKWHRYQYIINSSARPRDNVESWRDINHSEGLIFLLWQNMAEGREAKQFLFNHGEQMYCIGTSQTRRQRAYVVTSHHITVPMTDGTRGTGSMTKSLDAIYYLNSFLQKIEI